jgi:hypothetical protein
LCFSGPWASYDQDVSDWKGRNQHDAELAAWNAKMDETDGWAMTGFLFDSAIELCIWEILL